MEARVQELRAQRDQDLVELETLATESPADKGEDGVGVPASSNGNLDVDKIQTEEGKVTEEAKEVDAEHE